jgi:hypothetical protein
MFSLGYRAAASKSPSAPIEASVHVSEEQCEAEHDRWACELFLAGIGRGPRDDVAGTHPDLVRYKDFPPDKKAEAVKKDRDPWLNAPEIAAIAFPHGFERRA